jgi:signal transduction histidine kinase
MKFLAIDCIHQTALFETKKSYVRYLSHELRTPLNSAALGLKLLINELSEHESFQDLQHYDTACDANDSVAAAVDILDRLLLFDTIHRGILQLKKQDVNVLDFLHDCVRPFVSQAREKGIEIHFTTDASSHNEGKRTVTLCAIIPPRRSKISSRCHLISPDVTVIIVIS